MKIDFKKLIINILIPVLLGAFVGLLTSGSTNYSELVKPSFAPPPIVFPIVWTILYILMGISSYLIDSSLNTNKTKAKQIYIIQLIFNLLWSFLFFTFKLYLLSFLWIIILIILVIIMIVEFFKISKISAYLQIPYLLWLVLASALNFSIYILN